MLELFTDEVIVSQLSDKTVTLTSHRIVKQDSYHNQSVMLEHVTSCENKYTTKEWMIWAARILFTLCIIAGYYLGSRNPEFAVSLGGLSVILLIAYYFSRNNQIIIGSPSTKMFISVSGIKRENILHFINQIEKTKNNRIVNLNSIKKV
jgi:hypothetical protein